MGDLRRWMRQCELPRCDLPVVVVQDVGGKLERFTLDPDPVSWEAGGRWRVAAHQPHEAVCNVSRVHASGRAFGVRLYRPHAEVCRDTQVHRRTVDQKGGRA